MNGRSFIVMASDGTVLSAAGDAPADLVGRPIGECTTLGPAIRAAAQDLLHRRAGAGPVAIRTVSTPGAPGPLLLIAVDAVAIRRAPTDVRKLVTSKLAVLFSQATTAGITLSVDHGADVPAAIHLDAEKVAWAVTTLVGNALRYAQTGSRDLRGKSIAVTTSYDSVASEVTVEVRDDGPGVQPDTVRRLFRRDGLNVRGTGLSLLLISDIMAAHGGRIDVQSSTDPVTHGTAVRLTFPAD
jgi:signal transduction histidine kinase